MTDEELKEVTREAAERLADQVALDLANLIQLAVAKLGRAIVDAELKELKDQP